MRRPNIVLFMADQLSALALSAYGNNTVIAPNIARLSERGVTFLNAYCNSPICGPSRSSMLTGMMPTTIGVYDNAAEWPASTPTLMHYLRHLGYHTTLSGKMHFVGGDQLHGYHERLVTDLYPADFTWVPDWTKGPRNAPSGINMRAVTEAGPCIRSLQIDFDEETTFMAKQKIYDLARTNKADPFFLTVSLTHPHSPFTASQEHWDRYDHENIDMPTIEQIALEELDQHSRWLYFSHGRDRLDVTESHVRNARHAYYAMTSYLDDKLGEILKSLEETKQLDDAVFIFISDHGEMMGERGMWYKQTFFENSTRVPMIVCGPGIPEGKTICQNVSLIDLLPTILALANDGCISAVTPLAGADMTNLIFGTDPTWRDRVLSEYTDMGVCAPTRMIREGNYKYMYTHGHPGLLYDLDTDPLETINLTGRSALATIEQRLLANLLEDWDPIEIHSRVLQSQRMRRVIVEAVAGQVDRDNWSYEFRMGDKDRYVRGSGSTGTSAVKGRARYPFVEPMLERDAPQVPKQYMT